MSEKTYLAVPTAYNIYKVNGEVLQSASGMMAVMPAAVVMETLVMQGQAKIIARIKPYDVDLTEAGSEELANVYDPEGEDEEPTPDIQLPGPWFVPDEEDDDA